MEGSYTAILKQLEESGNLRRLPEVEHDGGYVIRDGRRMLNLSSNDYLGLASRVDLQQEFFREMGGNLPPMSSSSSRLLTGNFSVCTVLEKQIAADFGREAALLFGSGYHANTGILPALADKHSLILADKLVHASLIDGIRLGEAECHRYRHNDYNHLEHLLEKYAASYEKVFIVTESVFSMDGDVADLPHLVMLKKRYPQVMLYVDEAHAVGVRGEKGLGVAEECGLLGEIDLLVGTFGKAMASMGAYLVCDAEIREFLVNKMRPLIFSTALPPMQVAWTLFLWRRLSVFGEQRQRLHRLSDLLAKALQGRGGEISGSHIVPCIVGDSRDCILVADRLQREGFYCLPVRPPTVPQGTSRIRFSLTAAVREEDLSRLLTSLQANL